MTDKISRYCVPESGPGSGPGTGFGRNPVQRRRLAETAAIAARLGMPPDAARDARALEIFTRTQIAQENRKNAAGENA